MRQTNGFTLIEMLIILTIISLLSLLVVPSLYGLWKQQEINNFFNILDADLLYIQNETLVTRGNVRIAFESDHYIIGNTNTQVDIVRNYPDSLTYSLGNNLIRFNNRGTLLTPNTHRFYYGDDAYVLVFPLGKGRHYIEKR